VIIAEVVTPVNVVVGLRRAKRRLTDQNSRDKRPQNGVDADEMRGPPMVAEGGRRMSAYGTKRTNSIMRWHVSN
jgi:hypothetical protein